MSRRGGETGDYPGGGYTITMKGIARADLRDSYHLVIGLSWPRFILLVVALHITINVGFALLYLVQPGTIASEANKAYRSIRRAPPRHVR
jgi:inward rectifier potassium channel